MKNGECKIGINISKVNLCFKIIVSVFPYLLINYFYGSFFQSISNMPVVSSVVLIFTGVAIVLFESEYDSDVKIDNLFEVRWIHALVILFLNIFSLICGEISILGIMMIVGIIFHISRNIAVEFGFYSILFIYIFNIIFYFSNLYNDQFSLLIVGFLISFITAVFSIRFFMNYIREKDFKLIGIVKVLVGLYFLILIFLKLI